MSQMQFEGRSGFSDAQTEAVVVELMRTLNYEINNTANSLGEVSASRAEDAHIDVTPFALREVFPEDCVANATGLLVSGTVQAKQLVYTLMIQATLATVCYGYLRNSAADDSVWMHESFEVYMNWRASTYRLGRRAAGGCRNEVSLRVLDLRVALTSMLKVHGFTDTSFVEQVASSLLDEIAQICVSLKSSIAQGIMTTRLEPALAVKGEMVIGGMTRFVMQGIMDPRRILCSTGLGIWRCGKLGDGYTVTTLEPLLLQEAVDVSVLDWDVCA